MYALSIPFSLSNFQLHAANSILLNTSQQNFELLILVDLLVPVQISCSLH